MGGDDGANGGGSANISPTILPSKRVSRTNQLPLEEFIVTGQSYEDL